MALLIIGLSACADPHVPLAPDFGNAVSANIAAQVINPAPNVSEQYPTTNGQRAAGAVERYRTEHVYPPVPPIEESVKQGTLPQMPESQSSDSK